MKYVIRVLSLASFIQFSVLFCMVFLYKNSLLVIINKNMYKNNFIYKKIHTVYYAKARALVEVRFLFFKMLGTFVLLIN